MDSLKLDTLPCGCFGKSTGDARRDAAMCNFVTADDNAHVHFWREEIAFQDSRAHEAALLRERVAQAKARGEGVIMWHGQMVIIR